MALATNMMGVGYSAEQAMLMGYQVGPTTAGVGTASVGAAVIKKDSTVIPVTTAGGATAVRLPSDALLMRPYIIWNQSSTAALVFPSTGGAINGGSTDASFSVAQNKPTLFFRLSTNVWIAVLSA